MVPRSIRTAPLDAAAPWSKIGEQQAREKAQKTEGPAMPQRALAVLAAAFVMASAAGAFAQGASPDAAFNDAQREGLRLFSQSCGVCHTLIQQRTKQYGPVLSRETLGGDEEAMRDYIGQGTPRMPGFRFNFEPDQINAIVQYIKTIPPQAAPAGAR
jgi:mono/diheme cytochrome c family protein